VATGGDASIPVPSPPVLTEEQQNRIAANRNRALEIRREKRLQWLHNFSTVSHVAASPDQIEQIVRPFSVQHSVRTGSTLRNRFAFGRVKQAAAVAATAATRAFPSFASDPKDKEQLSHSGVVSFSGDNASCGRPGEVEVHCP